MQCCVKKYSEFIKRDAALFFDGYMGETLITWVKRALKGAIRYYPGFNNWFNDIVLRDLNVNNHSRDILFIFICDNNFSKKPKLAGLAIIKNTIHEKKICSFKILNKYRRLGLGRRLMEACMIELNTRYPMITVSLPNCNFDNFYLDYPNIEVIKFLYKFNGSFNLTQKLENYYRVGYTEYVFNGKLV